jgi:hypothetical protein
MNEAEFLDRQGSVFATTSTSDLVYIQLLIQWMLVGGGGFSRGQNIYTSILITQLYLALSLIMYGASVQGQIYPTPGV